MPGILDAANRSVAAVLLLQLLRRRLVLLMLLLLLQLLILLLIHAFLVVMGLGLRHELGRWGFACF